MEQFMHTAASASLPQPANSEFPFPSLILLFPRSLPVILPCRTLTLPYLMALLREYLGTQLKPHRFPPLRSERLGSLRSRRRFPRRQERKGISRAAPNDDGQDFLALDIDRDEGESGARMSGDEGYQQMQLVEQQVGV